MFAKSHSIITTRQAADLISATLHGDPNLPVTGICPLDDPMQGCLVFSRSPLDQAALQTLKAAKVALCILPKHQAGLDLFTIPYILTADPFKSFIALVPQFFKPRCPDLGISPKADVHPSAQIGRNVSIAAFCSIGANCEIADGVIMLPGVVVYNDVKIGARTLVHANAVIREGCEIGADCIIHAGVIIGSEGFGFITASDGSSSAVPQIGIVSVQDKSEVGANSCIDRATFGTTKIGHGSKIDNLVQIGHNVHIGKNALICGQAGLAGSSKLGNQVVIGAQTGIRDHVSISDNIRVGARSGISNSLKDPGDYGGYPAVKINIWRRQIAAVQRLPGLMRKISKIRLTIPPTENSDD